MYCCGELLTAAARKAPRYDIREGQQPHGKHRTGLGVQHGLIALSCAFLLAFSSLSAFAYCRPRTCSCQTHSYRRGTRYWHHRHLRSSHSSLHGSNQHADRAADLRAEVKSLIARRLAECFVITLDLVHTDAACLDIGLELVAEGDADAREWMIEQARRHGYARARRLRELVTDDADAERCPAIANLIYIPSPFNARYSAHGTAC